MESKETCKWLNEDPSEGCWKSSCGHDCSMYDSPEYNEWKYCPYCGKPIEEVKQ